MSILSPDLLIFDQAIGSGTGYRVRPSNNMVNGIHGTDSNLLPNFIRHKSIA